LLVKLWKGLPKRHPKKKRLAAELAHRRPLTKRGKNGKIGRRGAELKEEGVLLVGWKALGEPEKVPALE